MLEAGDGETARKIVGRHRGEINLLLTDISLPGQNGCDLAATLHRNDPRLEVLFMSGLGGAEMCEIHGLANQHHRFLQKPFGITELLNRVRQFLEPSEATPRSIPA